ncbi:MAG: hypothetical protein SAMD01599839_09280 [Rectinema sp.]
MKMKKVTLYILMLLLAVGAGAQAVPAGIAGAAAQVAQQTLGTTSSPASLSYTVPESQARALLAMATPDYPVTVGDVYTLSFMRSSQAESISLIVSGDGFVNAGYFGRIQTSGMSFRALKELLEKKVAAAYPNSSPSVVIVSTGVFSVRIQGEVTGTSILTAWGLTRLSEIVKSAGTPYSSYRDIQVNPAAPDGSVNVYDLFKAERQGDMSQDPYLRPGDVVEVKRAGRIVKVEGEVRRPGSYQLLEGEGVSELLNYYGDGVLESAKTDLVVVTRKATEGKPESESIVFDMKGKGLPELYDGDSVRVASREEYLPVVYIEGAFVVDQTGAPISRTINQQINPANQATTGQESPVGSYSVLRVPYRKGALLSQVVRPEQDKLSVQADLKNAYIVRGGKRIDVDLEKLLYAYEVKDDVVLQAEDRVVIPFGQDYAYVKGEVQKSTWVEVTSQMRLSMALKGTMTDRASLRDVTIRSEDGSVNVYDLFKAERQGDMSQDPYLRPGDVVEVKRAERIVKVSGEVRRPGSYQLLEGEGVSELLNYYGDGVLESAKTDLVVVTRKATEGKPESESIVFDMKGKGLPELYDGDSVRVASREEYLPVVYVEGAFVVDQTGAPISRTINQQINPANQATTGQESPVGSYSVLRVPYRKGALLSQVVRPEQDKLSVQADLKNAYIVRGGKRIAIDLEKLLYAYDVKNDVVLRADDRIVIPFGQNYAYVKGEVQKSTWVEVTSQMRLSMALKGTMTDRASLRDVTIRSEDGSVNVYDLFKAERQGDLSQDPYLRPGDVVEVKRAGRIVKVSGEVRRPGSYQLLEGEGVSELLNYYGDGVLESAKTDLVVVTRKATEGKPESESIVFDMKGKGLPELYDGDSVRVASREEYLPVVYVEGAVRGAEVGVKDTAQAGNAEALTTSEYRVVRVVYRKGQLLSQLARTVKGQLESRADLKRAFITRKGETSPISVDLEKLLYNYDAKDDVVLRADDHVIIPYGSMYAFVTGEVTKSSWSGITGLTRLSEVVKPLVTGYSSLRDVSVKSEDGSEKSYDLFKAERQGDLSQDPYLRPGDVVEVKRAGRIVKVSGEVRRPGSYQLLEGEGVSELLNYYGDGVLESAKTDLVVVTRKATEGKPESESIVFDMKGKGLPELYDGDSVRVASREEYLPVVYIEGAFVVDQTGAPISRTINQQINPANQATTGQESPVGSYSVLRVPYRKGALLSQVVRPEQDKLSVQADLKNAYIVRGGKRIAIDLEKLLYAYDVKNDVVLRADDRIVIPFGQNYAYVKGEVQKASWVEVTSQMRLSMALKGTMTDRASLRDVTIRSEDGSVNVYDLFKAERQGDLSQDPYLRPGDVVEVKRAGRIVKVEGEVRRPGSYQLLEGEGVSELLNYYGDGVLESAKTDLVVVTRKATEGKPESESIVFDMKGKGLPELYDGDSVRVASREEYLPVVYVEGAIRSAGVQSTQPQISGVPAVAAANTIAPANTTAIGKAAPQEQAGAVGGNSDGQGTAGIGTQGTDVYGFMRLPFKKGQLLSQVVKPEAGKLSEKADLKNAYIVRGGKRIAVDLEKLLYAYDVKDDVVLQAEDRIVIPFGQDYAYVKGEVKKAVGVKVETNLRLSAALKDNLTQIASLRDITVKSVDGSVNVYDLFKAERYGDIRQDPYLRPGDVVEVARAQRIISISGEVRRPGTYQLLEGEGLPELVMIYGDGFTEKANPTRMSIVRYVSLTSPVGEKIQLDYTKDKDMTLSIYDSVNVPAYQDLLPVAWFEGAIGVGVEGAAPQAAQRVPYTFFPGEMVSQAAQSVRNSFSEVSDLKNVYISRKGTKIPVNLEDFLYNRDFTNDMPLQAGDVIVIPFRQFFVTVSGAVKVPGRYPYVPDRTWEYYVGLAGGIDTDKNSGQKLTIYDVNSKVQAKDRIIQPEDNIVVAANSFTYSFSRIAVIMSTIISVASLVIALLP